jgi:manganese transport protein
MQAVWPQQPRIGVRSSLRAFGAGGAAFAVSIGYMDPGNWSTDFNATRYGVALLWSVIASGIGAILLQLLAVRLAAASGTDLATGILRRWPRAAPALWPIYVFSIVATETAEFTGVALGLAMALHLEMRAALLLSAIAFLALLAMRGTATRPLERLAILTTLLLASVYAADWIVLHPSTRTVFAAALLPSIPAPGALFAVIGIVGATIMPHNLFLHGGLIAEKLDHTRAADRPRIVTLARIETVVALLIATAINAAILVVADAVHAVTIEDGFATLYTVLGNASALGFGGALVVAGLAATATGARAGDLVFAAGAPIRLSPFVRRVLAIVPAALLLAAGCAPGSLLVASQIALGLVLPFVVVPLIVLCAKTAPAATFGARALLYASVAVVAIALLCDGAFICSFITHV